MSRQVEETGSVLEIALALVALAAAGLSPNLFVAAQAGYAQLSDLATTVLLPSLLVMAVVLIVSRVLGMTGLFRQIVTGIVGGLFATVALEVVREIGFHMGGMPGDMPKLLGVLLLDRFALGPSTASNIAGWAYHFWNGAAFGIVYSLLFGRPPWWSGVVYGLVIAVVFMSSPVVVAIGVGYFGVDFGPGFATTVLLAHVAFGAVLGRVVWRRNAGLPGLTSRLRRALARP